MLERLIGSDTAVAGLRAELGRAAGAVRAIGHRVANVGGPGFTEALAAVEEAGAGGGDGALPGGGESVDVEREMVALANEQLRYEAAASLLRKAYDQVRASVRER